MAQTDTTLTRAWQKVADAGDSYTLMNKGPDKALVQFKSSTPSDSVGFELDVGQGVSDTYGPSTDNLYAKLAHVGAPAEDAVVSVTS